MSIHLHRASRTDQLAEGLGELLAVPLADPFATDVVVVPTHGVERWLSQRLADRLGVCAGVDFRTPWSLFAALRGGEDDPWAPDAIVWPLLATIDDCLGEAWAAPLARHLGEDRDGEERELRRGRRFATARRLSRLFGEYATQRPSLIADWSAGLSTDGYGTPLADDLLWQPPLWRALAERIDAEPPHVRHAAVIDRLRQDARAADLPERVSLFGHTRLPQADLELVEVLGMHRDVHLWLPHPSPALWDSLATLVGSVPRAEDDSHARVGHPLLASLGRDVREMQRGLAGWAPTEEVRPAPAASDSLLGWLQADLQADEVGPSRDLREGDRSVQIHACHGPARQVEVLREVVLGLLADDPTLEPRDIVVMCPDIEAYAPLISSVFGLEGEHPAGQLRVSLADRASDQVNPLLEVVSRVLALVDGRAEADTVLDLAGLAAVRRRFGWDDDDLETVTSWVGEAGIRWGFDADHRGRYELRDFVANTWDFGLDRVAVGVAMSSESQAWIDRTLPLEDVGSGDVDVAGALMEFIERLRSSVRALREAHDAKTWRTALETAVEALAAPTESWQTGHLQRTLRERLPIDGPVLGLADVRALLADAFAGRPTRTSFRTGGLTVCTMMPMRSVPHRVVCLLGLDDGVFPRTNAVDGDDVLARDPRTGERDARSEDRQLLLDAVLAATDTLVITYSGSDVTSGQKRPPAVPLGELMDALEAVSTAALDRVVVRHPLQPFDARNLTPGALGGSESFSFDTSALAAARAGASARTAVPRAAEMDLPSRSEDVSLSELVEFFGSPVRAFYRRRLEVALPREDAPLATALPVEVDSLAEWAVGDRMLRDLLRGAAIDEVRHREWRRGELPPGRLGWRTLAAILRKVEPVARETLTHRRLEPGAVDVDIALGGGRRLRGTVVDVYGDRIISAGYSRLAAKARLQAWVNLLALSVNNPDRAWSALTIGRPVSGGAASFASSQLGPLDLSAETHLGDLVAVFDAGMRSPLPLPLKSSLSYATARRTRSDEESALAKAGWKWQDDRFPGEQSDPEHVAAWGEKAVLPGADPARAGEEFAGERTRFGALSMRIWSPLLDAEVGSW